MIIFKIWRDLRRRKRDISVQFSSVENSTKSDECVTRSTNLVAVSCFSSVGFARYRAENVTDVDQ